MTARALTTEETVVLGDLREMTYDEVSRKHGWSRGRIYALAIREGARKTEERIRERKEEKAQRRRETLASLMDQTATADVLDYLEGLPDGCARMVLTSIPYNCGKPYGGAANADGLRHTYYLGWMMQIISEMSRILKDGGTAFIQMGSTRDGNARMVPLDVLLFDTIQRTGLTFQSRVAWIVQHGLTPRRRLSERYETALVVTKGDAPTVFNPTPGRTPQLQPGKRAFKGPRKGEISSHPLGAWPSNVWKIGNVGHNHPERTGHPCQFPEELAQRAVQIYSNPGDLIVDPFSGSGTVHKVCRTTGRSFTGADLFYEDLRAQRLADAGLADVCPLPGVTDESIAVWQAEAVRVDLPAPGAVQLKLV